MLYQWQFRPYQRRFKQALQTSHGDWVVRDGIILRLVDSAGNIGWGEIAPIPWFGSETIEQALAFCRQLPSDLSSNLIFSIPNTLPSCQFAFESAWEGMREPAIGKAEAQKRRGAESQVSFATENSRSQPQNSVIAVQSSVIAAQNSTLRDQSSALRPQNLELRPQSSTLRPQNSNIAAQNSTLRDQSSVIAAQNSALRPQNSDIAVQNSTLRPQNSVAATLNSTFRPQNSDIAVQNSAVTVQNSTLQPQNSKPDVHPTTAPPSPTHSALLPAGEAALHAWKPLWEEGFRTFKWKIGVSAIASELEILHRLTQALPNAAKLRLDANGGLSLDDATQWLERCDTIAATPDLLLTIEYIEQPLQTSQFEAMQDLSHRYKTPIALDESVATLQQLQTCYENGWQGIFIVKPAIVGSPSRLRQFCQKHLIDAVFSSAFETAIGRQTGLKLAAELANPNRAVGYGTTHWFDDVATNDFEQLWQTL